MKIAIIGANGQLGTDVVKTLAKKFNVIAWTHSEVEIKDKNQLQQICYKENPNLIINTAAFHDVPKCKNEPEKAFAVNALGTANLAYVAKEIKATVIHISTDYVFSGFQSVPYKEDDLPSPLNTYGITKLAGEHYLRSILPNSYILRTSGLYGFYECRAKGGNFIDKMIARSEANPHLRVVGDEILTPTFTQDLAEQILIIIKRKPDYGVFHVTNEGFCSWFEFTVEIFSHLEIPVKIDEVTSDFFPSDVKRPKYSVLDNFKLKSLRINYMRTWQESLKDYLQQKYPNLFVD